MADEEKEKQEAPVEKSESAKPVQGTLDNFLNGGRGPDNIDKALADEADKANEQAKKEIEAMDKGEQLPEPKKKEEKKEDKKEEEEPISPELRARYKIPDNIKTMKALVDWGPNAEKNMQKALAEKDKTKASSEVIEKRLADMETALKSFQDSLQAEVEAGTMTEEERQIEEENLKYLQENKPLEYLKKIKDEIRKETLSSEQKKREAEAKAFQERRQKEQNEGWQEELDGIKKEYYDKDEGDKYETEVLPELIKIAQEKPYLQTISEARIIYLHNLRQKEEKVKAEDEVKRREKKENAPEASHGTVVVADSKDAKLLDAINDSDSIAELDKVVGLKH